MALLTINDLAFSYQYQKEKHKVLENLSLTIGSSEKIGLIGANGAGKSTFLKLLVGLLDKYDGEILVEGIPAIAKNMVEIRKKIGYVFQDSDHQLFMSTIYEDVAFAPRNYGYSEDEVKRRVEDALHKVHIYDLKDRQIFRLSGGEKKLASIATVLSVGVDLILFDEPSVALDPRNRKNLIRTLNELSTAMVIASHDLDFIRETCERTILLGDGHIVADGPTGEILQDVSLLENYQLL